jgi:hypothetical protein
MPAIDIVARAIDWLDACRSHTWQHMRDFYSLDTQVFVPAALPPYRNMRLLGIDEVCAYWRDTFSAVDGSAFELVEIYPGDDSVVLIYYDEQFRRVSEFLQFDDAGLIKLSSRHVIPVRQTAIRAHVETARSSSRDALINRLVLRCEARQSLGEARQTPVGPLRNALRQRAVALKALSERNGNSDRLKHGA